MRKCSVKKSKLERTLKDAGLEFEEYFPNKSKENHFYVPKTKTIHVVNTKDAERLKRDENLIKGLGKILKRDIKLKTIHYNHKASDSVQRFKHFAFDLADDVFSKLENEIKGYKKEQFINIIMGPFESFKFDDTEILYEKNSDYLNYKIIKIKNKNLAISLDYIFAGQAEDVLDKIFSNLNANLSEANAKVNVRVFHYGKVGVLNKQNNKNKIEIGDFCIPNSFIIEKDSEEGKFFTYPLENKLSSDKILIEKFNNYTGNKLHFGSTVTSKPILEQKRAELEKYAKEGARFVDMEWTRIGLIGMGKKIKYPNIWNIEFYLIASASDKPLEGTNLGNTIYKKEENERPISNFYKKIISNS